LLGIAAPHHQKNLDSVRQYRQHEKKHSRLILSFRLFLGRCVLGGLEWLALPPE